MNANVLNILIPMAGHGSRFAAAGYTLPKPLLPVHGRPMIEVVIDNIRPSRPHRFIFICQNTHLENYPLEPVLRAAGPCTEVIGINGVTEGAACTTLLAGHLIDNTDPLMIANCDQYVATRIDDYLAAMDHGGYDGFLMTMTASDPKWSYIRKDSHGKVAEVIEKRVVSDEATVGIYNFRRGSDYMRAARQMIAADDRTNNEFYVAPTYSYLVREGLSIGYLNIGPDSVTMYGLGVPDDLEYFNRLKALPALFGGSATVRGEMVDAPCVR